MKDIDKLKGLLKDFGVLWDEEEIGDEIKLNIFSGKDAFYHLSTKNKDKRKYYEENQTNVSGYTGFFTRFVFSKDGTFKEMGAWE